MYVYDLVAKIVNFEAKETANDENHEKWQD